jgi:hypothetical protein
MTWSTAPCTVRSLIVGTPNGRFSWLPGLRIHTRFTAFGRYCPALSSCSSFCIVCSWCSLYCLCTLVIDSGAPAFGDHLLQRSCQILGTPDFIDQSKPFTSFNPRFQGCQHAFGPDFRFHPRPSGLGFLPLVEPFPALPRVVVPSLYLSRFHLPASLGSTGITPLPCYYGGSVTSRAQFFGPSSDHERCSFPGS